MGANVTTGSDLLRGLNAQQEEAVTLGWGPALIVAGAGSGKTTVLTRRVAYLVSELGQHPASIMAVTFTNKAAGEMKHRLEKLLGYDTSRQIWIGTFHSICARLLRKEVEHYVSPEGHRWKNNFVIYDESDRLSLVKNVVSKMNLDEKVFSPKEMAYAISGLKNDGYTAHTYATEAKNYRETRLSEIFINYQAELARNNALDFDDLILLFIEVAKKSKEVCQRLQQQFRHLVVDEFQDTNKSQYELVRLISCGSERHGLDPASVNESEFWQEKSFMVVGDVDQSIYSWRKADYKIFLGFQNDFKKANLIKLEENYRSTSTILSVANSIIENNQERLEKVLRSNRGAGSKARCYQANDEIDEAFFVVEELKRLVSRGKKLSDCVVLYRTNAQSRSMEEVLIRSHLPYTMVGSTRFYDRQEIKDVIAYLKVIYNWQDGQSLLRVINTPRRGLGKTTIDRLAEYSAQANVSMLDIAYKAEQFQGSLGISAKAAKTLQDFAKMILGCQAMVSTISPVADTNNLSEQNGQINIFNAAPSNTFGNSVPKDNISRLLEHVLKVSGYMKHLEEAAAESRDPLAESRIENVQELMKVAKEFESSADEPTLEAFLTRISLVSDLDAIKQGQDALTLMTLHSAKGLEFPIVFMVGLEEGLFPHFRSLESPPAMEEERRLMYVGVTRAEDMLYLTYARKRMTFFGGASTNYTMVSRFMKEIQPDLIIGFYPEENDNSEYDQDGYGQSQYGGQSQGIPYRKQDNQGRYGQGYGQSGSGQGYGQSGRSQNMPYGGYQSGGARKPASNSGYGSGSNNRSSSGYGGGSSSGYSSSNSNSNSRYGNSPSSGARRNTDPMAPPAKPRAMRLNQAGDPGAANDSGSQFGSSSSSNLDTAPANYETLRVGDKVQHSKFGIGVVEQVIGDGGKELYNVQFDSAGKRLLDPRFAKLSKLD